MKSLIWGKSVQDLTFASLWVMVVSALFLYQHSIVKYVAKQTGFQKGFLSGIHADFFHADFFSGVYALGQVFKKMFKQAFMQVFRQGVGSGQAFRWNFRQLNM